MRRFLIVIGILAGLAAMVAAVFFYLWAQVLEEREARIRELEAQHGNLLKARELDPKSACRLVERLLLTRKVNRALYVKCDEARIDPAGEVVRLRGFLYSGDPLHAILGDGGHRGDMCLARTRAGWEVIGPAWKLKDCKIQVGLDAVSGKAAFVAASQGMAEQARSRAMRLIEQVRRARSRSDPVPEVCVDLQKSKARQFGLVDSHVLAGAPTEDQLMGWTSLSSGLFLTCLEIGMFAKPEYGSCGLTDEWRYVLLFDEAQKNAPKITGADTFRGGTFTASLRLIDLSSGRVICQRPISYSLGEKVVEFRSSNMREQYHRGVQKAICSAVAALTRGQLELDSYWKCE